MRSSRSPETSRRNALSNSSKNISTAFRPDRRCREPKNGFRHSIETFATKCRIAFRKPEFTAFITRRTGEIEKRDIYGEATETETTELKEEGIVVERIPWVPTTNS